MLYIIIFEFIFNLNWDFFFVESAIPENKLLILFVIHVLYNTNCCKLQKCQRYRKKIRYGAEKCGARMRAFYFDIQIEFTKLFM